jgi:hypothetical protein
LALFRLVKGNLFRAIWFSPVAGEPHMPITLLCMMPAISIN